MNISSLANSSAAVFATAGGSSSAQAVAQMPVAGTQVDAVDANSKADSGSLEAAVDSVQNFVHGMARNLLFSIDPEVGRTVIRVIDTSTNEVIRQIPSEEMLAIAKAIDNIKGVLIQQQA